MNKVRERCKREGCAKFWFASQRMFLELKYIKLGMYVLNVIPVIICFLPTMSTLAKLICSCVAFALTLVNEVVGSICSNYKEKAILAHQIYESEITGSSFSKTEYDRESTNDLNELAIRKGLPKMNKGAAFPIVEVPDDISDDYSYLYLARTSAAKTRFLLGKMFVFYVLALIAIAVGFIAINFTRQTTGETIYTLICIWPMIIPIVRNCLSCRKCSKQCVKICADIDNFFADGDSSVERLARFYYYTQNIEFEMMLTKPMIFKFIQVMFKHGANVLTNGVTTRFREAIVELKERHLVLKGVIAQPKGKELITKKDYNIEKLEKTNKKKNKNVAAKAKTNSEIVAKPVAKAKRPSLLKRKQKVAKTTAKREAKAKKDKKPKASKKVASKK